MSKLKMHSVVSSNISKVGYDEESQRLDVVFNTGKVYSYEKVPKYIYTGIFEAESPGAFFRKMVIKSGYKFKQKK